MSVVNGGADISGGDRTSDHDRHVQLFHVGNILENSPAAKFGAQDEDGEEMAPHCGG